MPGRIFFNSEAEGLAIGLREYKLAMWAWTSLFLTYLSLSLLQTISKLASVGWYEAAIVAASPSKTEKLVQFCYVWVILSVYYWGYENVSKGFPCSIDTTKVRYI